SAATTGTGTTCFSCRVWSRAPASITPLSFFRTPTWRRLATFRSSRSIGPTSSTSAWGRHPPGASRAGRGRKCIARISGGVGRSCTSTKSCASWTYGERPADKTVSGCPVLSQAGADRPPPSCRFSALQIGTLLAKRPMTAQGRSQMDAQIGPSIHIKGEVKAEEPLTIAGRVEGSVEISGHALTVTPTGHVDASIAADAIVVAGTVKGKLRADARIVVRETAVIEGDLTAPAVSLADGATLSGRVETTAARAKKSEKSRGAKVLPLAS